MNYIGIDNGVSGSVGIITEHLNLLYPIPTKSDLNYQKTKVKHITRVNVRELRDILSKLTPAKAAIERPMVNPQRFEATTSALRALEAVLIVLESLGIGYEYMDSKEWQKTQLPYISVVDKKEFPAKLKQVSLEVGRRLYPEIDWSGFKDADGILIAKHLKEKNIKQD